MTRPELDALQALLDKATPFAATSLERDLVNALPELIAYVRELEQQVQACGIRPRGKSVAPEAIAAALAMRERCADICSAMARERTKDPAAWATAADCAAAVRALEP